MMVSKDLRGSKDIRKRRWGKVSVKHWLNHDTRLWQEKDSFDDQEIWDEELLEEEEPWEVAFEQGVRQAEEEAFGA